MILSCIRKDILILGDVSDGDLLIVEKDMDYHNDLLIYDGTLISEPQKTVLSGNLWKIITGAVKSIQRPLHRASLVNEAVVH